MAMSKSVYMLMKRTTYLVSKSQNESGVTSKFVRSYRGAVLKVLGDVSFKYLEGNLDSWEGRWKVSDNFTWSKMYAKSSRMVTKKDDLYSKYEGRVLGAIDKVLGGRWWFNLSKDTQEEMHDALYHVFND